MTSTKVLLRHFPWSAEQELLLQKVCNWMSENLGLTYRPAFEIESVRVIRTFLHEEKPVLNLILKCRTSDIAKSIIERCQQGVVRAEEYLSLFALKKRRSIMLSTARTCKLFGHKCCFTPGMRGIIIDGVLYTYKNGRLLSDTNAQIII